MNKFASTLILTATIGLSSGCTQSNKDSPHIVINNGTPEAVTFYGKRVDLTICSTEPSDLRRLDIAIKENGSEKELGETTKVCFSTITKEGDPNTAVVAKTKRGYYIKLQGTEDKEIDGDYPLY